MEIEQIKEYQVFTDVGNAYLQALTREKLYIVGGPEFEELQGHVLVMYKALYGTRSGGACWHDKFFDILHHMGFKTSEVDCGGHDPNPNHVNESLLSQVDWGAHNPDADDPEQLTGESIKLFLTFVVQLQLLVAPGRPYLHKSLPCPRLWKHHLDLKTNIYGYISIFPRQRLIQVSIIYTHTHTHKLYIYLHMHVSTRT